MIDHVRDYSRSRRRRASALSREPSFLIFFLCTRSFPRCCRNDSDLQRQIARARATPQTGSYSRHPSPAVEIGLNCEIRARRASARPASSATSGSHRAHTSARFMKRDSAADTRARKRLPDATGSARWNFSAFPADVRADLASRPRDVVTTRFSMKRFIAPLSCNIFPTFPFLFLSPFFYLFFIYFFRKIRSPCLFLLLGS